MKNTPYIVPEGYFEQAIQESLNNARTIRKRAGRMMAAISAAAIVLVSAAVYNIHADEHIYVSDAESQEITEIYEADIFLQTFN